MNKKARPEHDERWQRSADKPCALMSEAQEAAQYDDQTYDDHPGAK